ncbi:hypothetical protein G9A89_004195 [Geosiphon pyriformis]|nr:hypothetical protein G9A89_004195 [Geosiphon pyriformis]
MSIIIIQSVMAVRDALPDSEPSPESRPIPIHLPAYNTLTNLSTVSLLNFSLSTAATSNLSGAVTSNILTTATSNLSNTHHSNTTSKPSSNDIREPKIEDHPKLEISNGYTSTNSQLFPPTIRILSAKFGHRFHPKPEFPTLFKSSDMLLFSGAALEEKLIMAMYTDAKINGHSIKLIFNSCLADSIITRQLMDQLGCRVDCTASAKIITVDGATKTPIGEINDFPIKVNDIIVPIKVLVMKATQYQALVGNDWLFKTNAMLDWTTQKLVLSQNGRHTRVPAMYGHFKATNTIALLIDLKEEKPKPT